MNGANGGQRKKMGLTGRKPWRDRHIDSKTVTCPTCKVAVGAKCVFIEGPNVGQPYTAGSHRLRRNMAVRLINQAS